MPDITLGGQVISYTVRESRRARTVRLRITPHDGLEVIVPAGALPLDVDSLLRSRAAWILKHYTAAQPRPERQFAAGETLLYLGQPRRLDVAVKPRGHSISITLDGEALRLRLPPTAAPDIRAALESWYRTQAKGYITHRTAELARQHGFQYGRLTIKGQSTRWGSCSSRGNLNFNWRLMFAPPAAVDYVIIHELCHLKEMNHSRHFWALVKRYCPDYQQWVRWFKTNGDLLRLD